MRTLLSWFGAERRGLATNGQVKQELRRLGLVTVPDFVVVYIDSEVSFRLASDFARKPEPAEDEGSTSVEVVVVDEDGELLYGASHDPSYSIGKLPSANKAPVTVAPNDSLEKAITLMLVRDFSQLPVMTNERDVKGIVSWRSIGKHLAFVGAATEIRTLMEEAVEVNATASLFDALPIIARHEYVLVRNPEDKKIAGIVTNSDLAIQFRNLAEPFLLLGEIENYIRLMLDGKFSKKEIVEARDPADADREVSSISDLALGEYIRILENEDRWNKVGLSLDRKTVVTDLHRVREIRNDVMHFDPDPLGDDALGQLRDFTEFLRGLKRAKLI